ncbi:MAG: hypothetical protein OMM_10974 [Candidatus Magnetoglobus multicellularis str. Araruama]|uniref:Uncharacterized protein n=1 Tax=Candidatus Magnetoglobus multicellularis str. Araruama TaxID=890399 RepID=A0A1V1NZK7_9BACT|nr:MAG: hypothetical protein OMM_10974 [Candidatus Magnetoglobus multicellularis str. Araruama]
MSSSIINNIKYLNEKAVRQLVTAHQQLTDEPLVLVIRYNFDDPNGNIYLLEVLDKFPGSDNEELLATQFGPSANLRIVGDLHLALGSPAQVQAAAKRRDSVVKAVSIDGEVVFEDGSEQADELKRELGLL